MKVYEYHSAGGKNLIKEYFEDQDKRTWSQYKDIKKAIRLYGIVAFKEMLNTRQLYGKLWEIKFSQNRIAYVIVDDERVMFVHAFQKQKRKTERKDLIIAIQRAKREGIKL